MRYKSLFLLLLREDKFVNSNWIGYSIIKDKKEAFIMKMAVACNWDRALIDGLARYKEVDSVYAKLGTDTTGGGRSAFVIPKLTRKKAEEYIKYTQSKGIKFNYLYNGACLGAMEFSREGRNKLLWELDWAVNRAGVYGITVATNYLFKLVRKKYPKLKVGIGIFMRMSEPDRFKYFEDLGASWIVVAFNANRDFKLLEKLRKIIKHAELHLFLNNICLYLCPHMMYHPNVLTHSSQSHNPSCRVCVDYHTWTCNKIKLDTPQELLKSRWIRPEDVKIYEDMGYEYFKLTDRSRATPWLLRAVDAYVNRRYDGNLMDILSLEIPGDERNIQPQINRNFRRQLLKYCKSDRVWLKGSFGWGKYGRPCIDNKKLEGFLNVKFYTNHNCFVSDCDRCGYCKRWAKRAVYFQNEDYHQKLRMILGQSIREFLHNNLFVPRDELALR
jgi:collagenase-like PrtC family protease